MLAPLKPRVGHGFRTLLSHRLPPPRLHPAPRAPSHPQCHHHLRLQPARDSATVMSNWMRSNVSREQLMRLIEVD
jgi:hypothetical protein